MSQAQHNPLASATSGLPSASATDTTAPDSQPPTAQITVDSPADERESNNKSGKRRFFGFGKKKEEEDDKSTSSSADPTKSTTQGPISSIAGTSQNTAMSSNQTPASGNVPPPLSPGKIPAVDLRPAQQPAPVSPSRQAYPPGIAVSPSRLRSSSPRLHSPASSEIFERNVQEPAQISTLQNELSPTNAQHIPAHVMTEDLIPPALEASAQAITSEELNPDEVEIVMSSTHQPAAATVLEASSSHADLAGLNSPLQKLRSEDSDSLHLSGTLPPAPGPATLQPAASVGADSATAAAEDSASNYGQLDPTDVRRLSFISFADVVQSEHHVPPPAAAAGLGEAGSRDSFYMMSGSSAEGGHHFRAASPLASPPLSAGMTTPPPPPSTVVHHAAEQSPARSATGALAAATGTAHGELTIETMRQAVRKTASGDLSAGRIAVTGGSCGLSSPGLSSTGLNSPVSDEGGVAAGRGRGNT